MSFGLDQKNLKRISYRERKRQEIIDICRTRKGSRAVNKEYGSNVSALIDSPLKDIIDVAAEVGEAIDSNIDDYIILKVKVNTFESGRILSIYGYIPSLNDGLNIDVEYSRGN